MTKSPTAVQRVAAVARQVAAVVAVVVGALQSAQVVPGRYGWVLTLVGGAVLTVEHYLSPNTPTALPASPGTTAPKPTATAELAAALHQAAETVLATGSSSSSTQSPG